MRLSKKWLRIIAVCVLVVAVITTAGCSFLEDWLDSLLEGDKPSPEDYEAKLKENSIHSSIFEAHLITEDQREAEPIRPINDTSVFVTAQPVNTMNELIDAVKNKKRPIVPEDQSHTVTRVYSAALTTLNNIILNNMTDYQKAHAIYDWLIFTVDYDYELLNEYLANNNINGDLPSFHINGVFLSEKAVCSGIAQAFALLCGMENIEAEYVTGFAKDESRYIGHAWNKVYVQTPNSDNAEWYAVDATYGNIILLGDDQKPYVSYLSHSFFMVTDEYLEDHYTDDKYTFFSSTRLLEKSNPTLVYSEAVTEFDYYSSEIVEHNQVSYDFAPKSITEFIDMMSDYAVPNIIRGVEVKLDFSSPSHDAAIQQMVNRICTLRNEGRVLYVYRVSYINIKPGIYMFIIIYNQNAVK